MFSSLIFSSRYLQQRRNDGDRDRYYSLAHSRTNFAAFQAAGGQGTFLDFTPPEGVMGHFISGYPALWGDKVATYLAERGL